MTPLRVLAPSLLALAFASCGPQKPANYDTATPSHGASASQSAATESSNPVYDTPAAYDETGSSAPAPEVTAAPVPATATAAAAAPRAPAVTTPRAPAPVPSNGAAIIHTVVAGDTLSGISSKYKVPVAAIKKANNMTNDTVVLGRKMVIPPVH